MQLHILSDEQLMALCEAQITTTDKMIIELLNMCPGDLTWDEEKSRDSNQVEKGKEIPKQEGQPTTQEKTETGTAQKEPLIFQHTELIGIYVTPIQIMEDEMQKRNLLQEFYRQHPLVNYENGDFLLYDNYGQRVEHLINCYMHGLLDIDRVYAIHEQLIHEYFHAPEEDEDEETFEKPPYEFDA